MFTHNIFVVQSIKWNNFLLCYAWIAHIRKLIEEKLKMAHQCRIIEFTIDLHYNQYKNMQLEFS